jgi:hypothetical protein
VTRRSGPKAAPATADQAITGDSTARLPFDGEVELSVLAECADPLHGPHVGVGCPQVEPEDFYDQRHARIFAAVSTSTVGLLSTEDAAYLANAVQFAFPVVAGTFDRFFELAARRRRLLELESERLDLLGVA